MAGEVCLLYNRKDSPRVNSFDEPEIGHFENEVTDKRQQAMAFAHDMEASYGRRLYLPEEIDALPEGEEARPLKEALHWLRDFIMRPHPNLGRPGSVCPYVKVAVDECLLYFTLSETADANNQPEIAAEVNLFAEMLLAMPPHEGPNSELRVILVLFPETEEAVFKDPHFQWDVKTGLMRHGVTMGEFCPTSDVNAALKAKFFPVQPPLPLFSLRPFIDMDWMFIHREAEWREIYIERFGKPPVS